VESSGIYIGDSPYSLQIRAAETLEAGTLDGEEAAPPPADEVSWRVTCSILSAERKSLYLLSSHLSPLSSLISLLSIISPLSSHLSPLPSLLSPPLSSLLSKCLLLQVTQWEEIAQKEYLFDGDQDGWDSAE